MAIQTKVVLTDEMTSVLDNIRSSLNKTKNTISGMNKVARPASDSLSGIGSSADQAKRRVDDLNVSLGGIVASFATVKTAAAMTGLSDEFQLMRARLDLILDEGQKVADLEQMIFNASQHSGAAYMDTAYSVASLGMNARDAFKSTAELVEFSELLSKEMKIAGTEGLAAQSVMYNLTQALSSGVLRGQDLNAVLSNTPTIVEKIAEEMNVPMSQIRDIASENKITAEIVKNAMLNAADEINQTYESLGSTFSQTAQRMKNDALWAVRGILDSLNEFISQNAVQDFIDSMMGSVKRVISVVGSVVKTITKGVSSVIEIFNKFSWILEPIVDGILTYALIMGTVATVTKLASLAQTLFTNTLTGTAGALGSVVAKLTLVFTVLNTVINLLNTFAGTSISVTGIVKGAFEGLGSAIQNVFTAIYNVAEWFSVTLTNIFNDPIYSIKLAWYNLVQFMGNSLADFLDEVSVFALQLQQAWAAIEFYGTLAWWNIKNAALDSLITVADDLIRFVGGAMEAAESIHYFFSLAWWGIKKAAIDVIIQILNWVSSLVNKLIYAAKTIQYWFETAWFNIKKASLIMAKGVVGAVAGLVNAVIQGINKMISFVVDGINGILGPLRSLASFAGIEIGELSKPQIQTWSGATAGIDQALADLEKPTKPYEEEVVNLAKGMQNTKRIVDSAKPERVDFDYGVMGDPEVLKELKIIREDLKRTKPNYDEFIKNYSAMQAPDWSSRLRSALDAFEKPTTDTERVVGDYKKFENIIDAIKEGYEAGWEEQFGTAPNNEAMGAMKDLMDKVHDATDLDGIKDELKGISGGKGRGGGGLGKIAKNTDQLVEGLDLSNSELKYLRDIAEREVVNRFTTAEIHISQENKNDISGEMDIDGVNAKLADGLKEAIQIATEGVPL